MNLNKIVALTKIFLKSSFQNSKITRIANGKSKGNGMKVLYLIIFLYVAAMIGYLCYGMITGLMQIHQETVFLGLFFLTIAFLLVFQCIFSCMNVFYFSKDIEYVLPWPLSPKEILAAKLNVILVTEYAMELLVGAIPLILYGILTGAGILYYLVAMLLLVIFPILPILIAAFLVMIIMSFAKLTKKKDSFQLIATLIIIAITFGTQMTISNMQHEMNQEQILEILAQQNSLVNSIENYFITLRPAINALTNTNLLIVILELLKILAITLIGYAIFILVGQKLYFRGVIGNLVGGKIKKKNINVEKVYLEQKVGVSYVKKEFRILFRNPIFFMQCVLPTILMPILFGGIMLFSIGGELKIEVITGITSIYSSLTIFVILGTMQFLAMMTYISSSTAISRDGLNATFIKYIPVPLYQQFRYKAIPNIIMNGIAIVIVEAIIYYLFPQTPLLFLVGILLVQISISIVESYLTLMIDVKKPKLEWTTEYAVVKQNMNLAFPMVFGLIGILVMVILAVFFSSTNPIITLLFLFAIFTIIAWQLDQYVKKHQKTLFENVK